MLDRHFRAVLDDAPDGVLIEQSGDRIVYANIAYAKLLGYPSTSELIGASIRDIAHPDDFAQLSWFGTCRREGKPAPTRYTFRAVGRDRATRMLDANVSVTRIDGATLITTIARALSMTEEFSTEDLALPGTKSLSAREVEVLQLLLTGSRSKEIAFSLGISEKTVCTHRSRAFQKLALRGDRDLFLRAAELGLI